MQSRSIDHFSRSFNAKQEISFNCIYKSLDGGQYFLSMKLLNDIVDLQRK